MYVGTNLGCISGRPQETSNCSVCRIRLSSSILQDFHVNERQGPFFPGSHLFPVSLQPRNRMPTGKSQSLVALRPCLSPLSLLSCWALLLGLTLSRSMLLGFSLLLGPPLLVTSQWLQLICLVVQIRIWSLLLAQATHPHAGLHFFAPQSQIQLSLPVSLVRTFWYLTHGCSHQSFPLKGREQPDSCTPHLACDDTGEG